MRKEYFDALNEKKRLEELFDYADVEYLGVACNLLSAAEQRADNILREAKKTSENS